MVPLLNMRKSVYHIPTTKDGLNQFENIIDRINYNKGELDRRLNKNNQ